MNGANSIQVDPNCKQKFLKKVVLLALSQAERLDGLHEIMKSWQLQLVALFLTDKLSTSSVREEKHGKAKRQALNLKSKLPARRRYQAIIPRSWPESLPVLDRRDERLDHFCVDEITVELIQLA